MNVKIKWFWTCPCGKDIPEEDTEHGKTCLPYLVNGKSPYLRSKPEYVGSLLWMKQ